MNTLIRILSDFVMIAVVVLSGLYVSISSTFEGLNSMTDAMEQVLADDKDRQLTYSLKFRDSGETYVVDAEEFKFMTESRHPERAKASGGMARTYAVLRTAAEKIDINTAQTDYGGKWCFAHTSIGDFHGKPVVVVSEIDISESIGSVFSQLCWVAVVIVATHWVTSALAESTKSKNEDFEINTAFRRWQSSFPDGIVYRVNAKTLRISESNLGGAKLLGYTAASEVEQHPIARVSEILANNLKSDMAPVEGSIEVGGNRYSVRATPVGKNFWLIRMREKDDVGRKEQPVASGSRTISAGETQLHAE